MNAQTEPLPVAVMFEPNGFKMPEKPPVRWYHWLAYYLYNLARKPKVMAAQRDLERVIAKVRDAMFHELLPVLWQRRLVCPPCRDAYMALKPQIYLSQIELIILKMHCENHADDFKIFHADHFDDFKRCEKLSAGINGFGEL